MDGDRAVLPSRSFISTRPTSKQLAGRRLTEFSLSAVFAPNGKIENQSLQLQWSEATAAATPSSQKRQPPSGSGNDNEGKGINLYEDLSISPQHAGYHHPSEASKTCDSDSGTSAWSRSRANTIIYGPSTSDAFATSSSSAASIAPSNNNDDGNNLCYNRRCPTAATIGAQMVSYVSVDLRIAFFQPGGLIVRKQVVKEIRNDLTVLEVLQHLIKCAGIELNRSMNCDTARLFCLRLTQNGKGKYEEIDYLQWRCALLVELTSSVTIQFVLDFTDTENGSATTLPSSTSSSSSSSARSICPIEMDFKE